MNMFTLVTKKIKNMSKTFALHMWTRNFVLLLYLNPLL